MRGPAYYAAALLGVLLFAVSVPPAGAAPASDDAPSMSNGAGDARKTVRFATYNAALNRLAPGELIRDLDTTGNRQAQSIAEVIQTNRPDVVLLNEFDYAPGDTAAELFRGNYLGIGQNGRAPIDYPYMYTGPSNTGVPSGFDLDNDGVVGGAEDALGFGAFEGQYGMVVFSKYPIQQDGVRTFRTFLWRDMPGALLPDNAATDAARDSLRRA